jgi:hypothetical protein
MRKRDTARSDPRGSGASREGQTASFIFRYRSGPLAIWTLDLQERRSPNVLKSSSAAVVDVAHFIYSR